MCGFSERKGPDFHKLAKLLDDLGWVDTVKEGQFYPRRDLTGLLIHNGEGVQEVDAMWWYLLKPGPDGRLTYNDEMTCFNARNLDSRMWKGAVSTHRAILPVSAVGESLGKAHYYMRSDGGALLGCLYRTWQEADGSLRYSMAVITRPPHPRFSNYHAQSIPLFLPHDPDFLHEWLQPGEPSPRLLDAINDPRVYVDLEVTPVKTFKRAEPLGPSEVLAADASLPP